MKHVNTIIGNILEQISLSDKHGYNIYYPNTITTTLTCVHQDVILWMSENLSGGWGWYWEEEVEQSNDCVIVRKQVTFTFELDEEAVLFSLAHNLNN
jgi:hypothetical protein